MPTHVVISFFTRENDDICIGGVTRLDGVRIARTGFVIAETDDFIWHDGVSTEVDSGAVWESYQPWALARRSRRSISATISAAAFTKFRWRVEGFHQS